MLINVGLSVIKNGTRNTYAVSIYGSFHITSTSFVMTLSDFEEIWYTCSVCGHKKTYKF